MNRRWAIGLAIAVLLVVAMVALAGDPPRVVYDNRAETINEEVRSIYAAMPVITAQKVTLSGSTSTGYRLPVNYGSATGYVSMISWVTNGGASFDLRVVNVDGDSVHIFRTGASGGTVNLTTIGTGIWGR